MKKLFDPIRKIWVAALPEEIVRQKLLHYIVDDLGYPHNFIAVEKDISLLPHVTRENLHFVKRRADIICFGNNIHPHYSHYPLVLIECKAVTLTQKVVEQVVGYNYIVGAYFVAVANGNEIQMIWQDPKKGEQRIDFLPPYQQLLNAVQGI